MYTLTHTFETGFSANSWNDRAPSRWRDAKIFTRPRNFRVYKEIIMKHPLHCFVTLRNYFIYLRIYYFKHTHTHIYIMYNTRCNIFFIHCLIVRDVGRRISPRIDRTREIEHTAMTWLYYVYNTHTLLYTRVI